MDHVGAVAMRWIGRLLILLAPYIVVSALFFPAGVQPLSPVICPDGLTLDNSRYPGPNKPDNAKLELVCSSEEQNYSVAVGEKVVLAAVVSLTLGLAVLYLAQRLDRQTFRAPAGPTIR